MNKIGKILCLYAIIFLLIAIPAFSQTSSLSDLQETVNSFSEALAKSLAFNSTMGLNWSDAYIGKLFNLPPHLGVGVTAGFTTIDFSSMNDLLSMFDVSLPDSVNMGGFPLPGYTLEARIGGFLLPFDIGVKFGYLNLTADTLNGLLQTDIQDFTMDYMLIGADIRYAIIGGKNSLKNSGKNNGKNEGKNSVKKGGKETSPFKLSIGVGYNYLKGGIGMQVPGATPLTFNFTDQSNVSHTLNIPAPNLGLNWQTQSLDFKAQASLKIAIVTPYIGVGASYAKSSAGYNVNSNITVDGNPLDDNMKQIIKNFGINGIDDNGFSQTNEVTGWSFRAFGGLSINVPFVKFDLTGMYDFISQGYGITFGIRFQI